MAKPRTPALSAASGGSTSLLNITSMKTDSNNRYDNLMFCAITVTMVITQGRGVTEAQILDRKRHLIQKALTTYGLNALKISARNNFGVLAMPFLLYHLVDMGYMTKEEDQMGYGEQDDADLRFAITEEVLQASYCQSGSPNPQIEADAHQAARG